MKSPEESSPIIYRPIFLDYCLSFIGQRYRWGGETPMGGWDCSGFVQEILKAFGKDPEGDQTSHGLYLHFGQYYDRVETADLGDLVFYGTSYANGEAKMIRHVAIALSSSTIIEAGGGGRSTHSEIDAISDKAFVRCRPINSRNDLVAIIRPGWNFK